MTKVCTRCGEDKPLSDFFIEKRNTSGRTGACRLCLRTRIVLWKRNTYSENREEMAAEARERNKRNGGCKRKGSPEKEAARQAVKYALRVGKLVKPACCSSCEVLTPSRKLHAHHDDYAKKVRCAMAMR